MIQRTRFVRALALALLVALGLAAAPPSFAEQALSGVVNVNTATVEELQLLPGIGASRAAALVAAREERGGFESVDDLLAIRGIGETALEKLRPFARVKGKTTARIP